MLLKHLFVLPTSHTPPLWTYPSPVWPDAQIDPDVLQKGFQKAIDLLPVVAARLVRKNGVLTLSTVNSKGAKLTICEVNCPMPSESAKSSAWNAYFESDIQPRFKEPYSRPLLSARLNLFRSTEGGGCALCVNFAHLLADGSSCLDFLKAWSYYCGKESGNQEWLPKQEPKVPLLSRSIPVDVIPKSKEDIAKYKDQRESFAQALHGTIATFKSLFLVDDYIDLRIKSKDLAELKQKWSAELEQSSKWVSSFEVLMTLLLALLMKTDGKTQLTYRAIVNIRERSQLAPKEYFGNALSYPQFQMNMNNNSLAECAFGFHEQLRMYLADESELNRPHFAAEYFKPLSHPIFILDRARYVQPFMRAATEGQPVVNSWIGFDWFGVDFGLNGTQPSFLRVASTFRSHRHVHTFPSSSNGDITIRIQMPPSKIEKFKSVLKDLGFADIVQPI